MTTKNTYNGLTSQWHVAKTEWAWILPVGNPLPTMRSILNPEMMLFGLRWSATIMDKDRLRYEEREKDSWINNLTVPNQPQLVYDITMRYDQYPHRVTLLRSGLANREANIWNQTVFAKCLAHLGPRGNRWVENRALSIIFEIPRMPSGSR